MGAYWTHETIIAEQQGHPVAMLKVEEWGVPSYAELVLVTSEERVASEPELVRGFLGAVQRGYTEAAAEQEAALDAILDVAPETDRAVEEEGLALLAAIWQSATPVFGAQTLEQWTTYADWMKRRGLIPADLDAAQAVALDILPGVAGTPVSTPTA